MRRRHFMIGETFNRLTVVDLVGIQDNGDRTWLCRCTCGLATVVGGSELRASRVKSCGCLRREQARERAIRIGLSAMGRPRKTVGVVA